MSELSLNFDQAVRLGAVDRETLAETNLGFDAPEINFPVSEKPRGLALRSLVVNKNWEGIWRFFNKHMEIYFMSVAFDLSDQKPVVMPPKELTGDDIYRVKKGEEIQFTLGDGAPLFFPRPIVGGLAVYVLVAEADKGLQRAGETLQAIHKDLTDDDGSVFKSITKLIKHPGSTIADEVLGAATAALQPLGTILKRNGDEAAGVAKGIYSASRTSWEGQLHQEFPGGGGSVTLAELS